MVRILSLFIPVLLILSTLQGCSVVKATSGPESKDLSVLEKGTDRFEVIAELGQPLITENDEDGHKVDLFKFKQGQNGAAKAGKGVLYGLMAVGTFGVSEIVTSPLEGTVGSGAEMQIKVVYNDQNRVDNVNLLKDERWIPVQKVDSQDTDSR